MKDAIVQYVQKNYKGGHDIAQSLIQGSKITLTAPVQTRAIPVGNTEADIEAAKFAQEGHDILYTGSKWDYTWNETEIWLMDWNERTLLFF